MHLGHRHPLAILTPWYPMGEITDDKSQVRENRLIRGIFSPDLLHLPTSEVESTYLHILPPKG